MEVKGAIELENSYVCERADQASWKILYFHVLNMQFTTITCHHSVVLNEHGLN